MRVLVYGDFIIDRYVDVVSTRSCPEMSSAPVWDVQGEFSRVGCAGNTLRNILQLRHMLDEDVQVFYGGMLGEDAARRVSQMDCHTNSSLYTIAINDIEKKRIVQNGVILGRLDSHKKFNVSSLPSLSSIPEFDLLVVSDYGFGAVTGPIAERLISASKVSVIDSKRDDLTIFRGSTVIKLNSSEYDRQVARMAATDDLCVEFLAHFVVVSLGEHGCRVAKASKTDRRSGYRIDTRHFPAYTIDSVVDVTGCGDTFTAALALSLVSKRDIFRAADVANYFASRVVTQMGPSVPDHDSIVSMRGKFI